MYKEAFLFIGSIFVPLASLIFAVRLLPKKDQSDIFKDDFVDLKAFYKEQFEDFEKRIENLECRLKEVLDDNDKLREENFDYKLREKEKDKKIQDLENEVKTLKEKVRKLEGGQ